MHGICKKTYKEVISTILVIKGGCMCICMLWTLKVEWGLAWLPRNAFCSCVLSGEEALEKWGNIYAPMYEIRLWLCDNHQENLSRWSKTQSLISESWPLKDTWLKVLHTYTTTYTKPHKFSNRILGNWGLRIEFSTIYFVEQRMKVHSYVPIMNVKWILNIYLTFILKSVYVNDVVTKPMFGAKSSLVSYKEWLIMLGLHVYMFAW